jgi:hypothetical protein
MRIAAMLTAMLVSAPLLAADAEPAGGGAQEVEGKKGKVGQFDYEIAQIDVSEFRNGVAQATLGISLTNTGKSPVRVAIVPSWPTVQLIGDGAEFSLRGGGVSGLKIQNIPITACKLRAEDFTLLRPGQTLGASMTFDSINRKKLDDLKPVKRGRFNANIMVQSLEDQKCWTETLFDQQVPVVINR